MSRWIVDASNVIGSRPDGWWRDRPRALRMLLDEVTRWRAENGEPVVVVADGHPTPWVPEGDTYGVQVRYAHSRRRDAADDEIVRFVDASADPGDIVVATSDRRLRERVRARGAGVEGARSFRRRIAAIPAREADRAVLAHFGVEEADLLGRGGEARVFALGADRVLRLPHPGVDLELLVERRRLLDAIAAPEAPMRVPEVLEHRNVEGRWVAIERRLPGRDAMQVLTEPGTDRTALIRSHLHVARQVADLRCPTDRFGELWGGGGITAPSFGQWAEARVAASLRVAGDAFAGIDPTAITTELVAALDQPDPPLPVLVHLDIFLGNLLAEGNRISAVLDFGPMAIGGVRDLDPLVAVAYLAPEITPTASDSDRAAARDWAVEAGLGDAVDPAERWIAAYWTGAPEDQRLRQWCRRILLDR